MLAGAAGALDDLAREQAQVVVQELAERVAADQAARSCGNPVRGPRSVTTSDGPRPKATTQRRRRVCLKFMVPARDVQLEWDAIPGY